MSFWHILCRNIPQIDKYIKPVEYTPKPNTIQLTFIYCFDELILKINTKTQDCICYFNQAYSKGNLLDRLFFNQFINLLELYFTPYQFH